MGPGPYVRLPAPGKLTRRKHQTTPNEDLKAQKARLNIHNSWKNFGRKRGEAKQSSPPLAVMNASPTMILRQRRGAVNGPKDRVRRIGYIGKTGQRNAEWEAAAAKFSTMASRSTNNISDGAFAITYTTTTTTGFTIPWPRTRRIDGQWKTTLRRPRP